MLINSDPLPNEVPALISIRLVGLVDGENFSFNKPNCILKNRLSVNVFLFFFKTSEKLFIIFTHKVDNHTSVEVEFSSESGSTERIVGTLENEYALSVSAPGEYQHWKPVFVCFFCWCCFITVLISKPAVFVNLLPRYACWSGVAHHALRPVQHQLAASYILHTYGRNQSPYGKSHRSC